MTQAGPGGDQVWRLLQALAESAAFVQRGTDAHRHDAASMRLLALAGQRAGVRPTDITAELELTPSAVTRRVRALEQAGHLAARPDPGDARAYTVELTDVGRRHLEEFRRDLSQRFGAVLRDWDPDEIATLVTLLTRLNDGMRQAPPTARRTAKWWRQSPTG